MVLQLTSIALFLVLAFSTIVSAAAEAGVSEVPRPPPSYSADGGPCARSIFETRVPWTEGLPDETASRLSSPGKHPDRNICGSFANQPSCCSDKTLQDLVAWADAIDSSIQVSSYWRNVIQRDPRFIVDQVLVAIRSSVENPDAVNWKELRLEFRDKVGQLITSWWQEMYGPLQELWTAIVTYQEGLLCSACEPNFARFYDGNNLKVRAPAAADVGDAAVKVMNQFDSFLLSPVHQPRIKEIVQQICNHIAGQVKCVFVPTALNGIILYLTMGPLRNMMCGDVKGDLNAHNQHCKDFIMKSVLRGLFVDTEPIVGNIITYAENVCPKNIGVDCGQIAKARTYVKNMYWTFDERPVVTNTYIIDGGFDIRHAACDSNLSGFACGQSGPKPESHKAPAQAGGNAGAIIITVVVLVTLATIGAVLFVSRDRIKRVTQSWYTRMRDDGMGPTVGLV